MARNGKKSGGKDFKPGVSGNPHGAPKVPAEVKKARTLNRIETEILLNKFLEWPVDQLEAFVEDKRNPALEVLIASILAEAIKRGDQFRLNFLLDRLIGKVKDELDVNHSHNLHKELVNYLNGLETETELLNPGLKDEEDGEH